MRKLDTIYVTKITSLQILDYLRAERNPNCREGGCIVHLRSIRMVIRRVSAAACLCISDPILIIPGADCYRDRPCLSIKTRVMFCFILIECQRDNISGLSNIIQFICVRLSRFNRISFMIDKTRYFYNAVKGIPELMLIRNVIHNRESIREALRRNHNNDVPVNVFRGN